MINQTLFLLIRLLVEEYNPWSKKPKKVCLVSVRLDKGQVHYEGAARNPRLALWNTVKRFVGGSAWARYEIFRTLELNPSLVSFSMRNYGVYEPVQYGEIVGE